MCCKHTENRIFMLKCVVKKKEREKRRTKEREKKQKKQKKFNQRKKSNIVC